jgi:hypothetical protein
MIKIQFGRWSPGRLDHSQFESPFGEPTLMSNIVARLTVVSNDSCSLQILAAIGLAIWRGGC